MSRNKQKEFKGDLTTIPKMNVSHDQFMTSTMSKKRENRHSIHSNSKVKSNSITNLQNELNNTSHSIQ